MKGTKLFILVLIGAIVFWVGFMYFVSGGLSSWSFADKTEFRWMLGLILLSITRLWWKFADLHTKGEEVLLKGWKLPDVRFWKPKIWIRKYNLRLRHCFELCGWLFGGVAVFGLGGTGFMQIMHYITTALAAFLTYLIVVRSSDGINKILYASGLLVASLVWVMGFLKLGFSVYLGEFLFMIPVIVWVFNAYKYAERNNR